MSNHTLEQNSFLSGPNGPFIADLYGRFLDDPGSIDPSWQGFFRELDEDARAVAEALRGASWTLRPPPEHGNGAAASESTAAAANPKKLNPRIPRELSTVIEVAMERERHRRYQSAQALAEDLRAYLELRVVKAHQTGAVAELRKWVARNSGVAWTAKSFTGG